MLPNVALSGPDNTAIVTDRLYSVRGVGLLLADSFITSFSRLLDNKRELVTNQGKNMSQQTKHESVK